MKKSELRNMIKEEMKILTESEYKIGDVVKPKLGPHKGWKHRVIFVFPDGKLNIQPIGLRPNQIRYRLGAAGANPEDVERA